MAFSHITIIYNPNSTGPSKAMAEQLAARLQEPGPGAYPAGRITLLPTKHAGHAEQLAAAAARAHAPLTDAAAADHAATTHDRPLIVSSSGDGGYHEVINGLMAAAAAGYPAAAAVLPAGNANDHRRTTRRAPLADSIRAGRTTRIDLLRVDVREATTPGTPAPTPAASTPSRYAHSYVGLGLTPVVAAELNRHTLNAFRELLIVVRTFARLHPVVLQDDAGRTIRLDSLILSNINQMAKTLTLSQTGRPTDGRFEVTAFPAGSKWQLLSRLLRAAISGLRADAQVTTYAFRTLKPTPIQLDGEVTDLAAGAHITVTAQPHVLETVL